MNAENSGQARPMLCLASASPRRRELLLQLGLRHCISPQDVDETPLSQEPAEEYVQRIALLKAKSALGANTFTKGLPILAADTCVVCDGLVLGKPTSLESCLDMLGMLSGRQHQVMTSVAIVDATQIQQVLVKTAVSFRKITQDEMLAYWETGEPIDKAGAYGIQGLGAMFVSRVEGSYSAVVGLPLFETMLLLKHFGISAQNVLEEGSK